MISARETDGDPGGRRPRRRRRAQARAAGAAERRVRLRVDVGSCGNAGEEFAGVVARPLDAVVLLPPRELVAALGQRDEEVAAGALALDARRERDRGLFWHQRRAGVPPALRVGLAPVLVRQQRGVLHAARAARRPHACPGARRGEDELEDRLRETGQEGGVIDGRLLAAFCSGLHMIHQAVGLRLSD